jgi:hypothetical protein
MTRTGASEQTWSMKVIMKSCLVLGVVLAACNGPRVDLGGSEAENVVRGDGATASDASSPVAVPPSPSPITPPPPSAPFDAASCAYAGPYSDGSGYLADIPTSCSEATGAQTSFTSTSAVAAALVGTWSTCGDASPTASNMTFVRALDAGAEGVVFASDGTFTLLAYSTGSLSDLSLVPATGASDTGTFVVLDASSSLGPGTYQVRLSASDGGVYTTQVVFFGATPRLRFFSPQADDYAPALTKKYQANVCGKPFGPVYSPTGDDDALARMQGRWARCPGTSANLLGAPVEGQGLEFPGDGTWYALFEDASGNLVRTTDSADYGTLAVVGSSPVVLQLTTSTTTETGLALVLGECGTLTFQSQFESTVLTSFEYVNIP